MSMKWTILLLASLAFIVPLELMRLPAALVLGAMAAAILVAVFDGKLAVPRWPFVLAQGLIGCLVARNVGPAILVTMVQLGRWKSCRERRRFGARRPVRPRSWC